MSVPLTPSKRPHDRNYTDSNGKGKWQKLTGNYSQNQSSKSSHNGSTFRILCPVSKIDSIIGKDGSIISQICQEAGVKIRVEETVPGCDETVLHIADSDKEPTVNFEHSKEDGGDDTNVAEEGEQKKEDVVNHEEKESVPMDDLKSAEETSDVQKALLFVFERLLKQNQRQMEVMRKVTSLQPLDKLPTCASASDEVVQITGEVDAVRKALQYVSQQLLENPPRDHESFPANTSGPSHPPSNHSLSSQGVPYAAARRDVADFHSAHLKFHEGGIPGRLLPSQDMLTYRVLCHDERVGGVIGKGGAIIKTLQQETGCEIKVLEAISDSEDRILLYLVQHTQMIGYLLHKMQFFVCKPGYLGLCLYLITETRM
ncbi:hypothetical protein LWI28_015412 [Acer negundo]|uniref:K Homology domain-containing protein n=1 Tax=Acer negundo TaxID=4023 RepID=A0AAD5JI06_ACENE|nr:hypothetical protein LWI28_015412 [Acer negundo]